MSDFVKMRVFSGATRVSLVNVTYDVINGVVEVPKANYKDLLSHGFQLIKEVKPLRPVGRPRKQENE